MSEFGAQKKQWRTYRDSWHNKHRASAKCVSRKISREKNAQERARARNRQKMKPSSLPAFSYHYAMRNLFRIALCAAFLLVATSQAWAQRSCPIPPPSPFRHNGNIVTRFDASARRMITSLDPMLISGTQLDGIFLQATFTHLPRGNAARQTVDVMFVSVSRENRFRAMHDLSLMLDGRLTPVFGTPQYRTASIGEGAVMEMTKVTLSLDGFRSLVRARRVSARLGMTELNLREGNLEALREVASLIAE